MTLSKDERKQSIQKAFMCIADTVGDEEYDRFEFDFDTPGLKGLPETTLRELEDFGILENVGLIMVERYRLTPYGLIEVLRRTGQLDSPETKRRVGILASVLKAQVKGRHGEETVQTDLIMSDVATQGVPSGWVYNALRSSLLSVLWPNRNMNVELELPMCAFVHIPARFGMEDAGVLD